MKLGLIGQATVDLQDKLSEGYRIPLAGVIVTSPIKLVIGAAQIAIAGTVSIATATLAALASVFSALSKAFGCNSGSKMLESCSDKLQKWSAQSICVCGYGLLHIAYSVACICTLGLLGLVIESLRG